jgi:iron complex outermembrane recepter protein
MNKINQKRVSAALAIFRASIAFFPVYTFAESKIDEIIVTAQKRSESIQSIPVAITALGQDDISRRGIVDVESLAHQVPNLQYGEQTGGTFIILRGVGTAVDTGVAEPSVALYSDGIYLPRATMGNIAQNDLERIEVLRGPQGTLYGRNATGGAINMVTAAPSEDLTTGIDLRVGNYSDLRSNAYISGALSDSVLVRLSGGQRTRDGFTDNIFNGQDLEDVDQSYGRAFIRIMPSEDLTMDFHLKHFKDKSKGSVTHNFQLMPQSIVPINAVQTTEPDFSAANFPTRDESRTTLISGTIDWSISDSIDFRSITGYVDHDSFVSFDSDGTSYDLLNISSYTRPSTAYTQEFNLIGESGALKWIVGAYYFDEKFESAMTAPTGVGLAGLPGGSALIFGLDEDTTSYALFTDLTYSLTDHTRLLFGGRYNKEDKDFSQDNGVTIPGVGFLGTMNVPFDDSSSDFLPKIGIQFDFSDSVMAYGQFQQGFKSGGLNLSVPEAFFEAETVDAYELGLKSSFYDDRVTLNASVFHYDYANYQIIKFLANGTNIVVNGDAEVDGLEVEMTAQVGSRLRLNGALTLLNAEYTEFLTADPADPAGAIIDLSGNNLNRAPEFTLMAGLEYALPIGTDVVDEAVFRADIYHSDDVYFRPFNAESDKEDAYTMLNISASLEFSRGHSLRFFLDNATDEIVITQLLNTPLYGTTTQGNYAPPRTYGAELSLRF